MIHSYIAFLNLYRQYTEILFNLQVMERSDLNKMNAQNLAVVFGPNLVWSEIVSMSLAAIGPINMFTQFLLIHHNDIFMI